MAIMNRTVTPKPAVVPVKPGGLKPVSLGAKPAAKLNGGGNSIGHEAKITVTTTKLEGGTIKGVPVETKEVEILKFATNPANVGVSVSHTKNLGNYEALKIGISVNMPCYVEEVDNAFAQVLDKAKSKFEETLAELSIGETTEAEQPSLEDDNKPEELETKEEATEDGEITPEFIDSADREALVTLCIEHKEELQIDPDDYVEDDDLRTVLKQSIFGEETQEVAEATEEAAAEEEQEPYTQEYLEKEGDPNSLKQVFEAWQIGVYPKGPPQIAKKAAIRKILEFQAKRMAAS